MIEKIKEILKNHNLIPLIIMETPQAGEEVDNGCGLEFPLSKYAIIVRGSYDDEFNAKDELIDLLLTDYIIFNEDGCRDGIESLAEELKERDGYEIIYKST